MGFKNSYASHFAAGDMYVDYVGTGPTDLKYRVTLILYKVCEPGSIDLGNPETVYISSNSAGYPATSFTTSNFPLTVDTTGSSALGMGSNDTVSSLCPSFSYNNSCKTPSSPYPGYVRYTYIGTVILPQQANDWVFAWTNGSRNAGITNLCNPGSQNITLRVGFNNLIHYDNESPRFIKDPYPYYCVNKPAVFAQGAVDPNGDSIRVISKMPMGCSFASTPLCTDVCGPETEIPYNAGNLPYPYSVNNPINSSSPYAVNPINGTVTFLPTVQGKYVLAYRCIEYDRQTGDSIGFTTRDIQVFVLPNCNNSAPPIDSIPINVVGATVASGNLILSCPGSVMSFTMQAKADTGHHLTMSVNAAAAPGCTLAVVGQGTNNPQGTFTWTPGPGDVGDHIIIITAADSSCTAQNPIIFSSSLVVVVKIINGIDAGPDRYNYCGLNGQAIQLQATAGISGLSYVWKDISGGPAIGLDNPNIANPKAIISNTTSYVVSTNQLPPACKSKDTMTVFIDKSNTIKITTPTRPAIQCRPGYTQLTLATTGPRPLQNLTCGTQNPQPCINGEDSTQYIVPANGVTSGTGTSISTPFYSTASARHQYLLKASDLISNGLHSGTLKSIAFRVQGTYSNVIFKNLKVSLKCTTKGTLNTTAFETGTIPVYTSPGSDTFNTVAGSYVKIKFDTPYNWDTTQNLIIDMCYSNGAVATPMFTYFTTTSGYTGSIYATATSGSVCSSTTAYVSSINNIPAMYLNYCAADSGNFIYSWTGNYISDSTRDTVTAYINKTATYVASTKSSNGCFIRDTITIFVPTHNFYVFPLDTAICSGQSVYLHARNGVSYKWYEGNNYSAATSLSCNNCTDPLATPTATTTYHIVINDSVSCADTLTLQVVVKPLPNVHILNGDTTIKYGTSFQLIGSGAYLYSWSPSGSLSDPNIVNPIASPTEPTIYTLWAIGSNQCSNTDSVRVNIDYRDHLLIPTAFTPNGDGKNDEFKIVNLTFQKLMEFRVFNRWGQEIFSTTDGHRGWDGTWKGVAQDMGVYNYIIRVGYPDGYVETYKGDVTVVR